MWDYSAQNEKSLRTRPRVFLDLSFASPSPIFGLVGAVIRSISADGEEVDVINLADRFSLRDNRLLFHSIRLLSLAELARNGLSRQPNEEVLRAASAFILYPTFSAEDFEPAMQIPWNQVSAGEILTAIVLSRYAVENGNAFREEFRKNTREASKFLIKRIAGQTSSQLELLGNYFDIAGIGGHLLETQISVANPPHHATPAPSVEIGTLLMWIALEMFSTLNSAEEFELEISNPNDQSKTRKTIPLYRTQRDSASIEFDATLEDKQIALLVPTFRQLMFSWNVQTQESMERNVTSQFALSTSAMH
jgi:hypothetical protein